MFRLWNLAKWFNSFYSERGCLTVTSTIISTISPASLGKSIAGLIRNQFQTIIEKAHNGFSTITILHGRGRDQ